MIHALTAPWSHTFMVRAFAEAALVGITAGALGCWVVLHRIAYSAESLPHAMLPGLVIVALAGGPLVLGGAGGLVAAALCIALVARVPRTEADTRVAVVVTTLLGLGVVLALSPSTPAGLDGLLFGDVLGATWLDVALAAILSGAMLAALAALHWRLLAVGVDRPGARTLGISPPAIDAALLVLLAVTVLVAVQGLGNLLVVAAVVAPAAAARLHALRLPAMMALAVAIALTCSFGGLYLSYYVRVATGATIALLLVGAYAASAGVRALTYHRSDAHAR
jgi:ABC-type Mn2+/Zn2+ transport system permease subunit